MSFRGGSDRTRARTTAALQSAVCLAQEPMQFTRREKGIVLHNAEWGITLFTTPYDTP